jgi:hypothetical protein
MANPTVSEVGALIAIKQPSSGFDALAVGERSVRQKP